MAKTNTTSVTAFENKNIEGATKSAPSGKKKGAGKFRVVHVAGKNRSFVCKDGTLDADGTPKEFSTKSAAAAWIDRNHPSGMTWEFEIYDNLRGETVAILKPGKAKAGSNPKTADKAEKAKTDSKPKTADTADKVHAKSESEPQKAEIIPADRTSVVACTKEQIREHLKTLDDAVASFESTFFKIGLELYWFYTTQAYVSIDGVEYANIADFAKKRYGISKATTYQYINVYDRFGKLDTVTGDCIGIDDKYKDYGSTQLLVMSQMPDEIIAKCTPSQKIAEMKALLKGISDDDDDTDNENGDGAGGENTSTRKPFNTIKTANTQELYSISSVEELEKIKDEIINTIRKTVGQGVNGVNYGVSVVMTW